MKTKFLLKIITALFVLSGWSISLQAQTIKVPVKKKVVNQVNTRANNDVDKALDKGFDKIEKGIGGLFKKKHKKKGKHSHTEASNSHPAASNSPTVANSTNQRFQGLNRDAIANLNNEIINHPVYLTNHNGVVAGKGSVFVYKTSEGNYGKLEIIDIDKNANYKTTFRYVTYANDGSIVSQSNHFSVRGTYTCDLDNGTEEGTPENAVDFQIGREDNMNTRLDSYNGAAITLYKGNGKSTAAAKTPNVKWAKYDFVPGQTVIFEDGPAKDEENGEFPSRWDLYKGSAEIAEMDSKMVIMFLDGGGYIVPYLKNSKEDYLPDVFTVEFDAYFEPGSHFNRYWISLNDLKNQYGKGPESNLEVYVNGIEFGNIKKRYPGTEKYNWGDNPVGGWKHIAIAYTKGKFKAYMDDTRLINVPHLKGNPSGITIQAESGKMYIKNIRIAKGGVKYYDRVLSDGKIVENGIRFDVNKATLKPESMGPINKIYKLMVKYPSLNFSVEGHTDSDGDTALNQKLSEERAKAVMDKLIAMGIASNRLRYKGLGESMPIDNNATPEGKANNRRVEFVKF